VCVIRDFKTVGLSLSWVVETRVGGDQSLFAPILVASTEWKKRIKTQGSLFCRGLLHT